MQIRRLHLQDAEAHRALRLRSFLEQPQAFTTSHAELQREPLSDTEKRVTAPHAKFWGAFDGGALCGHVGLQRETREKCRHKATLVGLYVVPQWQGRGIGRALIDALLREARADEVELIVLTVTEGNSGASTLYERCGFRSFGVEPLAIKVGGRYLGKNHMYIDLKAASTP